MKVLVPLHGFINWNGGVDLIRVIVTALRSVAHQRGVELVFTRPESAHWQDAAAVQLRELAAEFCAGHPVLDVDDSARGINRAAIEANANIVFPLMKPIKTSHVKKVGYIYDFQHLDLPAFFTDADRRGRDHDFGEIVRHSDAMFATSKSVAGRIRDVHGVAEARILAMPFTPYANAAWFDLDPGLAQQKYSTGRRYVMICNHFWMHKDHLTAVRAFAKFVAAPCNSDVVLVLTGDTSDYRDPKHYTAITELIASLGIAAQCRIPGLIPKADQIALLREAMMLVQPTLYEGGPGGGATYEAVGLGRPVVLSDIAVNLEAHGDGVRYFRTGDADDLAAQMLAVVAAPRIDAARDDLLQRAQERLQHTGHAIVSFLQRIAIA